AHCHRVKGCVRNTAVTNRLPRKRTSKKAPWCLPFLPSKQLKVNYAGYACIGVRLLILVLIRNQNLLADIARCKCVRVTVVAFAAGHKKVCARLRWWVGRRWRQGKAIERVKYITAAVVNDALVFAVPPRLANVQRTACWDDVSFLRLYVRQVKRVRNIYLRACRNIRSRKVVGDAKLGGASRIGFATPLPLASTSSMLVLDTQTNIPLLPALVNSVISNV